MQYILIAVVMFWIGWKLGRRYQDFQDIMLARRVAKLTQQREQIAKEQQDYERWHQQDLKLAKMKEMPIDE